MTNLLVSRSHIESGSIWGTYGKKEKPFDYSWESHGWYWKDESMGDEGKREATIQGIAESILELCAEKMKEQGIKDNGNTPFIARIKGKKVTRIVILDEDISPEEFEQQEDKFRDEERI